MSDYPRPAVEEPRTYRPDRFVGWIGFAAYVGITIYWLYSVVVNGLLNFYFREEKISVYGTFAFIALLCWLFTRLAQGRRGAFFALFWLLGFLLAGNMAMKALHNQTSWIALASTVPFWFYCVARLCGILGPRPGRA